MKNCTICNVLNWNLNDNGVCGKCDKRAREVRRTVQPVTAERREVFEPKSQVKPRWVVK